MLDDVTAVNMNKLISSNGIKLEWILTKIKKSANEGRNNVYFGDYGIPDGYKQELEKRGFTVTTGGRYNEVNTKIEW